MRDVILWRVLYERENVLYLSLDTVKIFCRNLLIIRSFLTRNHSKSWFTSACLSFLFSCLAIACSCEEKLYRDNLL